MKYIYLHETSCKSVLRVNMKNKFHSRKFASTVKNGLKLIENQAQIRERLKSQQTTIGSVIA